MRFWIDIANSPHATLFAPIVRELEHRGHEAVITAWDRAQTEQLARSFWPEAVVVGAGSERGIVAKGLRIRRRAAGLAAAVAGREIDVVLGHNSYAQLLAARRLRRPAITMMDYEHQPANHLAFRLAAAVMVPEAFPAEAARRQGAGAKLLRYPGFKEEITFADFRPDPGFRATLGAGEADLLVTLRPPPEGALYHRRGNALFDAAVGRAGASGGVVLLSPRNPVQAARYRRETGNVRVLDRAVDGANLLFHSDVVIGAGGTMTREAAILGTPSYTLFAGRQAAVDRALIASGRLTRVASPEDLERVVFESRPARSWRPRHDRVESLVSIVEDAAERLCAS